jgi:hypothetical protein
MYASSACSLTRSVACPRRTCVISCIRRYAVERDTPSLSMTSSGRRSRRPAASPGGRGRGGGGGGGGGGGSGLPGGGRGASGSPSPAAACPAGEGLTRCTRCARCRGRAAGPTKGADVKSSLAGCAFWREQKRRTYSRLCRARARSAVSSGERSMSVTATVSSISTTSRTARRRSRRANTSSPVRSSSFSPTSRTMYGSATSMPLKRTN